MSSPSGTHFLVKPSTNVKSLLSEVDHHKYLNRNFEWGMAIYFGFLGRLNE